MKNDINNNEFDFEMKNDTCNDEFDFDEHNIIPPSSPPRRCHRRRRRRCHRRLRLCYTMLIVLDNVRSYRCDILDFFSFIRESNLRLYLHSMYAGRITEVYLIFEHEFRLIQDYLSMRTQLVNQIDEDFKHCTSIALRVERNDIAK